LRVHIDAATGLQDDEFFRKLLERDAADADVTYGQEAAGSPTVLVSARPGPRLLDSPALRVLLVPMAGVPAAVWRELADRPEVAVHSCHFNAQPTAEMAFALLLAAAKSVPAADRGMREQDWSARFAPAPALLLAGARALVVGCGEVGGRIARLCRAVGMEVDAVTRSGAAAAAGDGTRVHPVERLRDLLPDADAVFVAAPLTAATRGLLGAAELALLRPQAVLVNVARPETVDGAALYAALRDGALAAAAMDIWPREPASRAEAAGFSASDLPFHELPNVVLSPHRAGGAGLPAVKRLRAVAVAAFVADAASGRPLPHREQRP
jgi:phosphoglycerate dehydrogenase-like enzyme